MPAIDDITAMKDFNKEREAEPPEAREAIWAALEARMEAASEEARAFGEAVAESASDTEREGSAGSTPPPSPPRRRFWSRHREPSRRRRLGLAFGGATLAAAVVAGALVLNSGPTAERASAAEILHEAAAGAVSLPTTSVPGPGQFLYRKEGRTEIQSWRHPVPPESANVAVGGIGGTMHGPHAYNALVSTTVSSWTGPKGNGRHREELGTLQFWDEEEARWKAAGSPPPTSFDPEYQQLYPSSFEGGREVNSSVVDQEGKGWGNFRFPDTSKLPTEGKELRLAAEADQLEFTGFNHVTKAPHLSAEETTEELINVLMEGEPTPQLQAAIFDALAELPGLRITEATDGVGRQGEAIKLAPKEGFQEEYLFDPESGAMLARRDTLIDPAAAPGATYGGIPAGTVVSERDYLEEATVDSTEETGQGQ